MTDEALLSWIRGGQSIALLLVTIGVAGEFIGDFLAKPIEGRLETTRQIEIAQLRERAAIAEKSLLELQERARPRTIDADARMAIMESLQFGGTNDNALVSFEFVSGSTSEPYEFAKALADILRAADWRIGTLDGGPAIGNPPRGVIIRISDVGGVENQARALQGALERAAIDARLVKDRERVKQGEIVVMVGLKP